MFQEPVSSSGECKRVDTVSQLAEASRRRCRLSIAGFGGSQGPAPRASIAASETTPTNSGACLRMGSTEANCTYNSSVTTPTRYIPPRIRIAVNTISWRSHRPLLRLFVASHAPRNPAASSQTGDSRPTDPFGKCLKQQHVLMQDAEVGLDGGELRAHATVRNRFRRAPGAGCAAMATPARAGPMAPGLPADQDLAQVVRAVGRRSSADLLRLEGERGRRRRTSQGVSAIFRGNRDCLPCSA